MKTIKILIVAPEELHEEKIQFSSLIEALNESLVSRGIELERVKWDPDTDGSVEDFMEEVGECEMCLTLYWRELAENASEELTAAFQTLKAGKNPQNLYVFFKEPTQDISEALKDFKANFVTNYGHFFCKFENVDTMNLHFILQFESYQHRLISADEDKLIVVKDGKVKVGEKEVVSLDNVPFAAMNKEYQRLQAELAELDQQAAEARKRWKADPDDEDLEDEYLSIKSKRKKVADEFEKYQNHLYDIALGFAKRVGDAISERMLRAKEAFERGDVVEADNILNMEEMKRQAEQEVKQFEQHRKNLELTIEEFRLKADTVMANTELAIPDRFAQACEAYEQAISLAKTIHYDEAKLADILFNYAHLLSDFKKLYDAISVYNEALTIYRHLIETTPDICLPKIALTLNNIAIEECQCNQYLEAEQHYGEALSLYKQLEKDYAGVHANGVAMTLNNLAVLQKNLHKYEDAEKNIIESIDIRRKLIELGNNRLLVDLAQSLNNLAILRSNQERYKEAEDAFLETLEIRRKIYATNPERLYEVGDALNNLAVLYTHMERYVDAENNIQQALEIRKRLAQENPAVYKFYVAQTLNNLAIIQNELDKYVEAGANLDEALEIFQKMANVNANAYSPYVAWTLNNLADIKSNLNEIDEAIDLYTKALGIYEHFNNTNRRLYTDFIDEIKSKLAELSAQ